MKSTTIAIFFVAACATEGGAFAQPAISAVLNAASSGAAIAPNSWIAIYGNNLASSPATAGSLPLQTTLGGVSVKIGNLDAPLLYVSPNQLNVLIPPAVVIPANTVVPLTVTSPSGTSSPYSLRLTRNAPGIFTRDSSGKGRALVFDAGFNAVNTIAAKQSLILYATGLGPTDASGRVVDPVEVDIGERPAQVTFAGLAPGFPGIYQLNVTAPVAATDRLYIRSGGWQSNITTVGIPAGSNALNVTGSIDGMYPTSDPRFNQPPCLDDQSTVPCGGEQTFSIMLHAGTFSAAFDIAPSATQFDVAAVGEAGGSIITIDPVSRTFTASVSTIKAAAAVGDFSQAVVPLWDYASCDPNAICLSFPNSILPLSRLDPLWLQAANSLPRTNATVVSGANAIFQASGTLTGSHFVIDNQNNPGLARFGGFVQVPLGPFDKLVSTFTLYVDGKVVATKDLTYTVDHR